MGTMRIMEWKMKNMRGMRREESLMRYHKCLEFLLFELKAVTGVQKRFAVIKVFTIYIDLYVVVFCNLSLSVSCFKMFSV